MGAIHTPYSKQSPRHPTTTTTNTMNTKPTESRAGVASAAPCSAVDGILARLPKGCTGVIPSTQYGMGFILTEQNEIVFRDDSLSHAVRKVLAEEVNMIIKPNVLGHAAAERRPE